VAFVVTTPVGDETGSLVLTDGGNSLTVSMTGQAGSWSRLHRFGGQFIGRIDEGVRIAASGARAAADRTLAHDPEKL
jgi:hypothetical protein